MNTSTEKATRQGAWETAYAKGQNFVFYPHEEIIRFLARHVRRRTGLDSYKDMMPGAKGARLLDVGCGIGRHLLLSHQMSFDTYGIDLSSKAIDLARDWLKREGMEKTDEQILQGDVRHLPWPEDYFQVALSHGVFDSMPTEIARAGIEDLARVMIKGGLFYCDLVAGNAIEETVESEHEKDTVQSYFDQRKIDLLFEGRFKIVEQALTHRDDVLNGTRMSRWHLILQRT
ncbi:methyltransferase type 11 [Tepidicaulis marinus]|uniref:Methyltransferase type 11 n=1 Tax=Tepidicaulis marinus TaxID=1333998 RepID=A0A081B9Q4_9HYPH|nr:class I SAM-dependent methyltransferase [Tepidicaulis marinus]GAK44772.1 methyltransferase type 11 [Tepidicaulis marinus]